jgi:hypothetical protein
MRCRTPKILLFALALMPLVSVAQERFALVIGNGEYVNVDPLPNPPNDVDLVSDALEQVGFQVTLLKNADRRTMDRAAKKFATQLDDAGRNTVGVFYFAGHGVTYEGENWLLPVGVDITQGADIEYETVSANKVLKLMEGARNATDILILDACRNSPFRGFSLSGTRAVSRGMSRMDAPTGSFIAYSTAPGSVAYDGDGKYSPFAEAFASEVATPGNSIGDMMIEVRKKVKQKTARLGPRPQTPWDSSSLTGRFAFNPGQSGSILPNPDPSPPSGQQGSQQSGAVADTRFWTSIENSTDPAEFEIYLKRFPDGQYADLARIRKERFSKQPDSEPVAKNQQPSAGGSAATINKAPQMAGASGSANVDGMAAQLCNQITAGDTEAFAECLEEYENFDDNGWVSGDTFSTEPDQDDGMPDFGSFPPSAMPALQADQSAIWYDDQLNQWQVSMAGASFSASAFIPGSGQLVLRGQTEGFAVSYGIFDSIGQQIGYGQGTIDDASHITVTSYLSNGALLGAGRFHVNHPPN